MIASAMNGAYLTNESMVIVPTHVMSNNAAASAYYFGLGQATNARSTYYDPRASSMVHHYAALPHLTPSGLHNSSNNPAPSPSSNNDMMVDVVAPLSPSSSNSTEQDEYAH